VYPPPWVDDLHLSLGGGMPSNFEKYPPPNRGNPNLRNEPTKQAPSSSDLVAPDSLPSGPSYPPSPSHRSGGGWAGGGTERGRRYPGPQCPPARTVRPPRPPNGRSRSRGRKKGGASPRRGEKGLTEVILESAQGAKKIADLSPATGSNSNQSNLNNDTVVPREISK